ncbi:MAG: undecaprenyl-phosphate galactose phosphotransferase WbaP [Pirellulaceae bacterium]|nr:undecaprenyl-phosphate galactose phosphotransferase WbaP [Pirellulaceae bacterium]
MLELQTSTNHEVATEHQGLKPVDFLGTKSFVRPVRWTFKRHTAYWWQCVLFAVPLLLVDLAVTSIAMLFSASALELFGWVPASQHQVTSLVSVQALVMVSYMTCMRLYRNVGMHPVDELERVVTSTALSYLTMIMVIAWLHTRVLEFEVLCLVLAGSLSMALLPSIRHLVRCRLGKSTWWRLPIVIINHSDRAEELIRELNREPHLGWRPVGYVDDFHRQWNRDSSSKYSIGTEEDLPELIENKNVFWGMFDAKSLSKSDMQNLMDRYHLALPNLISVSECVGSETLFSRELDCGSVPGTCYGYKLSLLIPMVLKRGIDILVASIAILCLLPIFVMLAIAVRCTSRGPIFYSQERIGRGGKAFRIWKFRSMVLDADQVLKSYLINNPKLQREWQRTQKLCVDPRITWIGKILRKTSLDELPQLWNVLSGTMSLVGPRPIIRSEMERYGDMFALYARATPGITGLWQVSGRNLTTYEERLRYDAFYVRNWSIWLDWYILLKTVRVVLFCEGAY